MKRTAFLCFLFSCVCILSAQIKTDSNYTILARGIGPKIDIVPFLLSDFNRLMIKENTSGKVCTPVSVQFTFTVHQSETFHTDNAKEVEKYVPRMKPKDIILPPDCFPPPKRIVITII